MDDGACGLFTGCDGEEGHVFLAALPLPVGEYAYEECGGEPGKGGVQHFFVKEGGLVEGQMPEVVEVVGPVGGFCG